MYIPARRKRIVRAYIAELPALLALLLFSAAIIVVIP
jgi:hypothetical protein